MAGGAQAVGALAYGLPEAGVAPVDRIVGPGNAWVTAAKLEVFGECGIDLPAGPSEVMVVADATADPAHVASDLLSQAEHGPDSPALLVTWDAGGRRGASKRELGRQLETAARREILEQSLARGALVVLAPSREAGLDFVNGYAPEHLTVVVDDVEEAVARLRNAGSLFVGPYAPESAGDYASGANHVLPTGGLARILRRPVHRELRQVRPGPAHHPRRPGRDPRRRRVHLGGRGPDRPQARRGGALRGGRHERRATAHVRLGAHDRLSWRPATGCRASRSCAST